MKALTVRQPWAWAIARGHKTIENRSWAPSHRGPLAIHAAQKWDDDREYVLRAVVARIREQGGTLPMTLADDLPPPVARAGLSPWWTSWACARRCSAATAGLGRSQGRSTGASPTRGSSTVPQCVAGWACGTWTLRQVHHDPARR